MNEQANATGPTAAASPASQNPTLEATSQAVPRARPPKITLVPHVGKDGVKLAQDQIFVVLDGNDIRVGYAGHGPEGGIVFIRQLPDELKLAIESEVAAKQGVWPKKSLTAPEIEDLAADRVEDEQPDEDFDEIPDE